MKIVILDGFTLNPGDLSWDGFKEMGEVTYYDRTPGDQEEIIKRAKGHDVLITNKTPLRAGTLAQLPDCKYIGVLATGYDVVDYDYARQHGIPVTNTPSYGTTAVSQMVFALLLEMTNHVQHHADTVKEGRWAGQSDFCYWDYPMVELYGKTLGLIGFGRIGRATAKIGEAMGMKIIAYDKIKSDVSEFKDFKWEDEAETVFEAADVISLHCPLFPETKGIVNKDTLSRMKKTAFLVNTSRGPLVVEQDLADALNNGKIAGAAVDVVCKEPPSMDNPLFTARNCIVTPHISWATREARFRLMQIAVDNLKAYVDGKPVNVVNK